MLIEFLYSWFILPNMLCFFHAACHVRMKRSLLVSENPISFNADHMFTFMIVDSGVSMSKQTKVIFRGCVRTCPEIVHTRDEF